MLKHNSDFFTSDLLIFTFILVNGYDF